MDTHSILSSLIEAGVIQGASPRPIQPPQTGYSPVLKAFAFALRPFITLDDDLAASGQVFLLGGPRQYGLPTSLNEEKYLNDAMFSTCDPIQSTLTPVYSQGGPSYFEWLRGYVQNVEDVPKGDKRKLQEAFNQFQAASEKADQEFREALKIFETSSSAQREMTSSQWMDSPAGKAYRDACADRDQNEAALKDVSGTVISEVADAQEALHLARSRQEYKPGYNMPCASRDIHDNNDTALETIYKPSYYLSGYANASRRWIMQGNTLKDQTMVFNPVSWNEQSWSRLGLTTLHNEGSAEVAPWIKDVGIIVKFRGIGAFDVHRGFWDISGLDQALPPLKVKAAPAFRTPVLKTTKLLVGYGVRVQIEFPPEILKALQQSRLGHFTLLPQLLAELAPTWNSDGTLEAALPAGNAYPVLLGILGQKVNVNNSRLDDINPPTPPASVELGSGSFNTMDVRGIGEPSKDAVIRQGFPKPYSSSPSLAVGLNWIDISKKKNIRVKAFADKITTSAGNININTWADTVLYSAGCSWLHMQANDPEFQTGQFSTSEDHEWNKTQKKTNHHITFPSEYTAPPIVIVWLNQLDMSHDRNWRIEITASDITSTGFLIHLDTWADTVLYSAAATWIAYPKGKAGIASGRYSTEDMRPWNMPQQTNWGWANFPYGTFKNTPTVITGISSFDVDCQANLRLALETHSVSEHGMNWSINSWADTLLYSAGGSYIAFA